MEKQPGDSQPSNPADAWEERKRELEKQWQEHGGSVVRAAAPTPDPITSDEVEKFAAAQAASTQAISLGNNPYLGPAPQAQTNTQKIYNLQFTGSANEYFRIWIVNIFLTIITLGIYAAWAKIRTRRYFYANTLLDGHPFEYHGQPIPILKGNILVGIVFGAYSLMQSINPVVSGVLLAVWFLGFPYLMQQSMRFTAAQSSYRNIRFGFHGSVGESYKAYFLYPLLTPFTLGLLFPYAIFSQRKFLLNNISYGNTRARFDGEHSPYYNFAFKAFGLSALVYFVFTIVVVSITVAGIGDFRTFDPTTIFSNPASVVFIAIAYLGFIVLSIMIQQYFLINTSNYNWQFAGIPKKLKFKCNINSWELIKLRTTNLLATVFTLGLAAPWAKVRNLQYVMSKLSVVGEDDLSNFAGQSNSNQTSSAIGDAATDFLNIDFGI